MLRKKDLLLLIDSVTDRVLDLENDIEDLTKRIEALEAKKTRKTTKAKTTSASTTKSTRSKTKK